MRLYKIYSLIILAIGLMCISNAQDAEIIQVHYRNNSSTLNDVCCLSQTAGSSVVSYVAVGNQGWIYRFYNHGLDVYDSLQIENGEYDLSGVSFGNATIGWVVGYKRETSPTGPKWQGGIWKTTDRGATWTRQTNIVGLPSLIANITPFLKIAAISSSVAWIFCGNGFVLKTVNGGSSWYSTLYKPGGSSHFGWLWGIWALNPNYAWVCSDQLKYYENIQSKNNN